MTAISLEGVTVTLGGREVVRERDDARSRRGVDRADRAERCGEDLALARGRRPAALRGVGLARGDATRRSRPPRSARSALRSSRRSRRRPGWLTVAEYVLIGRSPYLRPLAREGEADRGAAGARSRGSTSRSWPSGRSARSRVVSGSASWSRAHSLRRLRSCCSTSRPPASTSGTSSRRSISSMRSARRRALRSSPRCMT